MTTRTAPFLLALVLGLPMLSTGAAAQGPACHDLAALTSIGQQFAQAFPLSGGLSLRVDQRGSLAYQQGFGGFTASTQVPVASVSKTLSAAVLLALVDDGVLGLDDRLGQYLPEWNSGLRAQITLRHCFTHTSGLPANHPAVSDETLTLRAAAQQLASAALLDLPGAAFRYGGVSMHVAGAAMEVASGRSWAQLVQQELGVPLGWTATDFFGFGPTQNPRIAGGARSTSTDLGRFVAMLQQGGVSGGQQVLSAAAVDLLLTDQTSQLPVRSTPHLQNAPYGLGIWLDRRDASGRTRLASAAGAFGCIAWVDRDHAASGVWLVENRYQQVDPYVQQVWQALDAALLPDDVACVGGGSPFCAAGTWLNGTRAPRAGDAEFALRVDRAPPMAFGGLALGLPATAPLPLLDLVVHLQWPALAFTAVATDAAGQALLPVPLTAVPAGLTVAVQGVWLPAAACGSSGLVASHGLALTIR